LNPGAQEVRLKLAGFLLAATAAAVGQSTPQFGHRIGGGLAFLVESPDIVEPPNLAGGFISAENLLGSIEDYQRREQEWLANSTGVSTPLVRNVKGLTTLLESSKPSAAFETWAEQRFPDYVENTRTGFTEIERTAGKTTLRRFLLDDYRNLYVSYETTVETLPDGTYRVSFGPSSSKPPRGLSGWTVVSPAKYPLPQVMRDEDSIRLELYSNGAAEHTTRKLVDYVHVGRPDRMILHTDVAHDSYAEDAELGLTQPRFRVNGLAQDAVANPDTIRGSALWLYVPGHGRYVLTLRAEAGFEGAGEVAGNSLMFMGADGNVFRIDTAERIAAGSGIYVVHVLPDPGWEPADPADRARIMIGAELEK
jgi:hypothetical protein